MMEVYKPVLIELQKEITELKNQSFIEIRKELFMQNILNFEDDFLRIGQEKQTKDALNNLVGVSETV